MVRLQAFETAARQSGFTKVSELGESNVLWFRKRTAECMDGLTNSVTVYWMSAPVKVNSKTFRAVPALQEWFSKSRNEVQR